MSDWVRVSDPVTGHHFTTSRADAEATGAEILTNHEATDMHGRPLPPKYNTTRAARPVKDGK